MASLPGKALLGNLPPRGGAPLSRRGPVPRPGGDPGPGLRRVLVPWWVSPGSVWTRRLTGSGSHEGLWSGLVFLSSPGGLGEDVQHWGVHAFFGDEKGRRRPSANGGEVGAGEQIPCWIF